MKRQVAAVIIGAGRSGLAMSRQLADRGVDHMVFEQATKDALLAGGAKYSAVFDMLSSPTEVSVTRR